MDATTTATTARLLVNGIIFGIGAAVPIGPVNVEIARRTLRWGFGAGVALGCGAVTVDVTYTILAAIGTARLGLASNAWIYWPIAVAGVVILSWLGVMSLRGARAAGRDSLLAPPVSTVRRGYLTGIL